MTDARPRPVLVGENEHSLPYSKGLAASALMVTGLGPARAYMIANKVEQELAQLGVDAVTSSQLRSITRDVLRREAGDHYAEAYAKWQSVRRLQVPLIILIGGATGAGKSTIATQLATRLGITRVVSTDAVREVLRSAFTEEMFPTLYVSSFEADRVVRQPIPHSGDRLIIGFREQAAAVAVGAQALIDRAIDEGTDMILEGAHLVPGFLEGVDSDRAVVVPLVVTIEDEDAHRSHLFSRGQRSPLPIRGSLPGRIQEDKTHTEVHGVLRTCAGSANDLELRPGHDLVRDHRPRYPACTRDGRARNERGRNRRLTRAGGRSRPGKGRERYT